MTYYFGFVPSAELTDEIRTAQQLIASQSSERYDIYRDKIIHLINRELLDAMLVNLIKSLPDTSERKTHLIKLSQTIENTSDKLLNTILSPTPNKDVLASFDFFDEQVWFTDPMGNHRVGLKLDDTLATSLLTTFAEVQNGNGLNQTKQLSDGFSDLARVCLQHFLVDFTKTLPLNLLKRTAIPVADSMISKALDLALHRLIPQMPQDSLVRFTQFYQPMIFKIDKS